MSITKITIENYRSIKKCSLTMKELNLLIGQNGTGKTNILSAFDFFYKNLEDVKNNENNFDINNKFSNQFKIAITYDLRRFRMIAKSQILNGTVRYSRYYQEIADFHDEETLQLIKVKDEKIIWNMISEKRSIIYNLFPLCFLDSRSVNLTNWEALWLQIGSLARFENSEKKEFQEQFKELINQEKYKKKKSFGELERFFAGADINITPYKQKEFGAALSRIYFEGSEFLLRKNSLEFSSNGTALYNYTILLLKVLGLVAKEKLMEPIVLIDEPELSLHHTYIDYLAETLFEYKVHLKFVIATHSSRLIKDVLQMEEEDCNIYNVQLKDRYTSVTNMSLFGSGKDQRTRVAVTDYHANSYLSKLILAVEGVSEIEVFQNKYLRLAFSILKSVDIMPAMSDAVLEEIISPSTRHYDTPMISVMDMDKIIEQTGFNKLKINGKFNKLDENFRFYYGNLRELDDLQKKRINGIVKKCKFSVDLPFFATKDRAFYQLIELIKEYTKRRRMCVWQTTIEGVLVNKENIHIFELFLRKYITDENRLTMLFGEYDKLPDESRRLNFLRLLCQGESDFLLTLEQLKAMESKKDSIFTIDSNLKAAIDGNYLKKTSGWFSKWIEFYFAYILGIEPFQSDTFRKIKLKLKKEIGVKLIRKTMKNDFKELTELLSQLERIIYVKRQ